MPNTPTKVSDVIVPEIFNPYVREQSILLNAFFQSGIIAPVADLNFGTRGGLQIEMPYWKELGERAQLLNDTEDLVMKKIQSGQDTAVQHARALVYGSTDLAAALAGDDPMMAIGDGIAKNWSTEFNHMLLSTLQGALATASHGPSPATNTHDISGLSAGAQYIDGHSFIDAAQSLGDAKENIAGVAMHSAVESSLAKNDLIDFIRDSEGQLVMKTFMGKRVIVDDAMAPTTAGVYTTYLFGPGAIGWGEGNPKVPSETHRNPLINGGQEYLVYRRHFVLHPRGIRWTPQNGVPASQTPSDAELADDGNWTAVYNSKNVRLVRFIHKIQ
jgi:hypothetical protein